MNNIELLKRVSFNLTSVAHAVVGKEWNYKDVVSSYTRLYLITDGEATMWVDGKRIILKKDFLYIVPSFTQCTLLCEDTMAHYYATFTAFLPDEMSIYQLFNFRNGVEAESFHISSFEHLLKINPAMELPIVDPIVYQKYCLHNRHHTFSNPTKCVQTGGLLGLLFASFIVSTKIDLSSESGNRIIASVRHIHRHLNTTLSVAAMSKDACMTSDHFTRQFKLLTDQTPIEYINRQRVEKAQLLLNSTSYSCAEIADRCGFKSNAYFSRIFKKYVLQSPAVYRKNHVV